MFNNSFWKTVPFMR